jgi:hypothetical protein
MQHNNIIYIKVQNGEYQNKLKPIFVMYTTWIVYGVGGSALLIINVSTKWR